MRETGLQGRQKKLYRTTTNSNHNGKPSPNLLQRDFSASARDMAWVTDVKAIRVVEGWIYLAAITDLFSRRVVGWATSESNDTDLALDALKAAVAGRRGRVGTVHHSDRGSPYASTRYRRWLEKLGFSQSMSRKGDCWDNAVAESLFSTLEWELLSRRPTQSSEQLVAELADFKRRHSTIGGLSPVEFELRCLVPGGAA